MCFHKQLTIPCCLSQVYPPTSSHGFQSQNLPGRSMIFSVCESSVKAFAYFEYHFIFLCHDCYQLSPWLLNWASCVSWLFAFHPGNQAPQAATSAAMSVAQGTLLCTHRMCAVNAPQSALGTCRQSQHAEAASQQCPPLLLHHLRNKHAVLSAFGQAFWKPVSLAISLSASSRLSSHALRQLAHVSTRLIHLELSSPHPAFASDIQDLSWLLCVHSHRQLRCLCLRGSDVPTQVCVNVCGARVRLASYRWTDGRMDGGTHLQKHTHRGGARILLPIRRPAPPLPDPEIWFDLIGFANKRPSAARKPAGAGGFEAVPRAPCFELGK